MSRRGEIRSEIHHLERTISKYRSYIGELEAGHEYMAQKRNKIENEVYEPERAYDMTLGDLFRGNLESESERYREQIVQQIGMAQNDTTEFLSAINRAIDRLYELIEECEREISSLEDELNSLSEYD
ncbi:hypothetical protein [Butyrivibrio sp. M55]|uniref:hypothetical protein n=1 Tax=Butyrivibrio sp. M55 TaxID=1855323 RepID=UPI0008EB86EF|nr:hypothetical protein [Butyrivibrio sp. M55]SFU87702.1 hypothetical protein SAMN05216540_11619 [Butyrivibrio sp. M55]